MFFRVLEGLDYHCLIGALGEEPLISSPEAGVVWASL